MKSVKRIILTFGILVSCCTVMGQDGSISSPSPTFHWKCNTILNRTNSRDIINHNPVLRLSGRAIVVDSLPYAKDYTMIVVYKADTNEETPLWQMTFGDSATQGVTTERFITDTISTRYVEHTKINPIINTLQQSSPDSISPFIRLVLGDNTFQGRIKLAEAMFFNKRLGNSMLRRIQSALAIRYGITLGPVNYVDGNGNKIWDHADNGRYHHRVTGIGRDSTSGLYQIRSRSEMDGAILTIATDTIEERSFLMIGDDDEPLLFEQDNGGVETLIRQWRVQATGMVANSFSFIFDTRNLLLPTDSLVLLIDRYIILPSSSTSNEVQFDDVWLPSDTCTFTLARGSILWQIAQSDTYDSKGGRFTSNADNSYFGIKPLINIFPNPSAGHYTIEVSKAKWVHAFIYNNHGTLVATHLDSGKEHYTFSGSLPLGNSYYVKVTTESASRTMKLIVK
ncbi:MAG: T9SS type A sorting domain-containing protein [Bacteroidales bacterium]|nr:T9SS type A sorting domain-containing protein [Bacteroidales bacterium]